MPGSVAQLDIRGRYAPGVGEIAALLEAGNVLLTPDPGFELTVAERRFLSPDCVEGSTKNVSYRPASGAVHGARLVGEERELLARMLERFYDRSRELLGRVVPEYHDPITAGFTTFRPVEIAGRKTSWRQDDTRLHIDAFPSRPMQGLRILRIFQNVNPSAPRLWRVGECFEDVAQQFLKQVPRQIPGSGWLLHRLHVTKNRRTPYDHFMLGIHNRMKADETYQRECPQRELVLPPGATWMCFTDATPHAAMAGQFAFEQTFYLPVKSMRDPDRSPLRVLERLTGRVLA
jgi:hypothetical protein